MRKINIGIMFSMVLALLLIGYAYAPVEAKDEDNGTIYSGVYLDDVYVGGLTKTEALEEYEAYIKELRPAPSSKANNKSSNKKNKEQADNTQEIDKAAQRKEIMLRNASRSGFVLPEGELPPYIYEVYDNKGDFKGYAVSCPLLADYIRKHSNYIFVKNEAFDGVRRYWYINGCYRLLKKSSESPMNKGFTAVCSPLGVIRFHTSLPLPLRLIREKAREEKSSKTI